MAVSRSGPTMSRSGLAALIALAAGLVAALVWWYGPWNVEARYRRMDLVSLRQVVENNPKDYVAWRQLGLRLAKDGDSLLAEPALREAHALRPTDPEVATGLGELLMETKRVPEAFQVLKSATETTPKFVPAHLALGRLYRRKASYLHASEQYEAATAIDPSLTDAWYELGICYLQMQQSAKAQEAIAKALALDPRNARTLALKSSVDVATGKVDEGITMAESAAELAPDDFKVQENLSNILIANARNPADLDTAEKAIARLQKLAPQYPLLPFLRGDLERQRQHWDAAAQYLEQALAANPGQDEVYASLSKTYRRLGRTADAERLDGILRRRQELNRQMDSVRIALGTKPDDVALYIKLADLQVQLEDRQSAVNTLQNVLQLDPGSVAARERLNALKANVPRGRE